MLKDSPDRAEVEALYSLAGLDLGADLRTLSAGPRVKPDAGAGDYLAKYVSFDGELRVPVLSVHTTGDGLVIPANESAYATVVSAAGRTDLLRQVFVHRAGHCAFTPGEIIAALGVLLKRLDTGRWDDAGARPDALNAAAAREGAAANSVFGIALQPPYAVYTPPRHPRPFYRGSTIPS